LASAKPIGLHASAVLVGDAGVLVRGEPGAGKTQLALTLVAQAAADGLFARLIGDDRLMARAAGGRLVVVVAPSIAGLAERRGLGLTPAAHEPSAVIRLVVDLTADEPPRLPEPADLTTEVAGVLLPRLPLQAHPAGRIGQHALQIRAALRLFGMDDGASHHVSPDDASP
jgi:HPr kinase/phosphorylase